MKEERKEEVTIDSPKARPRSIEIPTRSAEDDKTANSQISKARSRSDLGRMAPPEQPDSLQRKKEKKDLVEGLISVIVL